MNVSPSTTQQYWVVVCVWPLPPCHPHPVLPPTQNIRVSLLVPFFVHFRPFWSVFVPFRLSRPKRAQAGFITVCFVYDSCKLPLLRSLCVSATMQLQLVINRSSEYDQERNCCIRIIHMQVFLFLFSPRVFFYVLVWELRFMCVFQNSDHFQT